MKKDDFKTDVIFYVEPEVDHGSDGPAGISIMAFFPLMPYEMNSPYKVCYTHIGQHSACHPEYIRFCRKAGLDEYQSLYEELEFQGYNLNIIN